LIKIEELITEYEIPNWDFRKPQLLKTVSENKGMLVQEAGGTRISDTNFYYHHQFPYDKNMKNVILDFMQSYFDMGYSCEWQGQCWHQVYTRGDYHDWHAHAHVNMSSVINIQCEEGQGTVFRIAGKEHQYPSREGTIVSFPSTLVHRTLPHESDDPRIIVSFNWDNLGVMRK